MTRGTSDANIRTNNAIIIIEVDAVTGKQEGNQSRPDQNNGIMGALEKELASSSRGIFSAVRSLTAGWTSTSGTIINVVAPYMAAPCWLLGWFAFNFFRLPHGADNDSLTHAKAYREELGDAPSRADDVTFILLSWCGARRARHHSLRQPGDICRLPAHAQRTNDAR